MATFKRLFNRAYRLMGLKGLQSTGLSCADNPNCHCLLCAPDPFLMQPVYYGSTAVKVRKMAGSVLYWFKNYSYVGDPA